MINLIEKVRMEGSVELADKVQETAKKYEVLLNNLNMAHVALSNLVESKFVGSDIADIISAFKYSYDTFLEMITAVLEEKMELTLPSTVYDIAEIHGLVANATVWKIIAGKRGLVMGIPSDLIIDEIKDQLPIMREDIAGLITRIKYR